MLHLKIHRRFPYRKHLKIQTKVNKKMHLTLRLVNLAVLIEGGPDGAPKDVTKNLHKNAQEATGKFESK